jgi:uncharacterized protein (TIGR03032 family)
MADGKPTYVTVFGTTDTFEGWRAGKNTDGCLIDVPSGEIVARGLSMPHSPRIHDGRVWLLNSGMGRLVQVDLASGSVETVAQLPGYTRGLALLGPLAFVGLSKVREHATFGGVPIALQPERLKCGVAIVELTTGDMIGLLEFHSGIDEIFDIRLLPGVRSPVLSGPHHDVDEQPPIWLAGQPTPG